MGDALRTEQRISHGGSTPATDVVAFRKYFVHFHFVTKFHRFERGLGGGFGVACVAQNVTEDPDIVVFFWIPQRNADVFVMQYFFANAFDCLRMLFQ